MSVAAVGLAGHSGPWTIADVEALPETGNHSRYEILSLGVLTVSPSPGTEHQRASRKFANLLEAAALAAGLDVEILEAVNVEIPAGRLTEPDIAVVDGRIAETNPSRYLPSAIHLIVEIVSSGSKAVDRAIKPDLYAEAGIPVYWRLELEPRPCLFVYELREGRYLEPIPFAGGQHHQLSVPFAIEVDPAKLTRR